MKIAGFEKLSLVDYDGYTACTVFTPGCNLRCPFCQNSPLLNGEVSTIDEESIFAHLQKRKGLIDAVCISGGEPTLQVDLFDFISRIHSLNLKVKLDTNGTNPIVLHELLSNELVDYVAMDIKNSLKKYERTVGCDFDTTSIIRSVELLKHSNIPYEFRTTVVRELHTEADLLEIGEWLDGSLAYFIQQFKDQETNLFDGLRAHNEKMLFHFAEIVRPFFKKVAIRGI